MTEMEFSTVILRFLFATLCAISVTCDTILDLHPIMSSINFDEPGVSQHFQNYLSQFSFAQGPRPMISGLPGQSFAPGAWPMVNLTPPVSGFGQYFKFPRIPIGFVGLPPLQAGTPLSPLAGMGKYRPQGGAPYLPVHLPQGQGQGQMNGNMAVGTQPVGILNFPKMPGPGKTAPPDPGKPIMNQAVGMVVPGPSLAEDKYKGPTADAQHHLSMNHLFVPIPVLPGGPGHTAKGPQAPVFADILIVIDASPKMGQIGPLGDVNWNPGVFGFINKLIQSTPMGPDLNRIGVVVVSVGIDDMIPITAEKAFLLKSLNHLRPTFQGGCTEKGISTASHLFYQYGRPNAVKRIVLVGEGSPKCPYRNMAELMYARKCGIDTVTVGFGPMLAPGVTGKFQSSWVVQGPGNLVDVAVPVAERAYITPMHGGWSPWSAWNPCSSAGTCSIGYQMRFRLCDNPRANFGGRSCDGYPAETRLCHMTPCIDKTVGHWSPWSKLSPCSSPCGIGTQTRSRKCLTLDGHPSATCKGKYVERSECIVKKCPVHGGWSPWSTYGLCSSTCGAGIKLRVRQCDSPSPKFGGKPCPGPGVEEMVCDTGVPCPINGGFTEWSPWGPCDVICGLGTQISERLCSAPLPQFGGMPCKGESIRLRPCDTGKPCAVHGNWGPWTNFGMCSVKCGVGVRVRERFCDSPPPSFGGAVCQGPILEEQPCDTGVMCPVHGGWTEWSKFGPCSAGCGKGFTQSFRECNNPAPMYGGMSCKGIDVLEKPCDTGIHCPIDGGWGKWSKYSKCSVKCGKGIMVRSRECNSPVPQFGGALCVGLNLEEKMCDTGVSCPVHGFWSPWTPWGPCSASCETGFRQRHRVCDNPSPQFGGLRCEGFPVEEEMCDTGVFCPVAGGWSKWSVPHPCPAKCGFGITKRVRECNSPAPMYGGPDCVGPSFKEIECDSGIPCPIHGVWSIWGVWGKCDKGCGIGMRKRIRVCDNPMPMFNGLHCDGPDVEAEPCDTGLFCPIDGQWSFWGKWSKCSVQCGKGVMVRERMCDSPMPQFGGMPCKGIAIQKEVCDSGMFCPIDGGWSVWSALSSCSSTCGIGVMSRSRVCNNPLPQYNGMPCAGPDIEKMPCDTSVPCPVHGNWGPWTGYSVCSVKCGAGFMKRERLCNEPAPMYGGEPCFGDAIEKVPCDTGIFCSIDGGWSHWSDYTPCAVMCGMGVITRRRTCTMPAPEHGGAPCKGIDIEEKVCDVGIPCPIDGGWAPWSGYTQCSAQCGAGFKQRHRECNNPPPLYGGSTCYGPPIDKIQCDTGIHCPIDGGWSDWGSYGKCSAKCGVGLQIKSRICNNPAPMYGGADCFGPATVEEPCDTGMKCPVNGMWTTWSEWAVCTVKCGKGVTKRVRECSNPAPLYGGIPCKGAPIETMECDTGIFCPIDGGWGAWGTLSICSAKCGVGVRQRQRECNMPVPQYGGRLCVGDITMTEPCDTGIPCPINGGFSAWSVWSYCTADCGEGIQTRSRTCDNPPPMYGGAECVGLYTQERLCYSDVHCPVDGAWGMWSEFNACSVKCGVGVRERVRVCDSPAPMYNGLPCKGKPVDVQPCNTGMFCPIDGRWSLWTKWSACSADCGVGLQQRVRSCTDPSPMYGGMLCVGDDTQEQVCNTGVPCPVHGNWGMWSFWTDCMGPCGMGSKTRMRECNDPMPQFGGLPCLGPDKELTSCNTHRQCVINGAWGEWTPWTKCSAVCGMGEISRTRLCDSPAPMYGGEQCYGKDLEIKTCDSLKPCVVHGGWSFWSPWSDCNVYCGSGTKLRYRECSNPTPLHGGLMCKGPDKEFDNCDTGVICPIDGQWSHWTAWGVCEAKCGFGEKYRSRICSDPAPAYGGKPCAGPPEEVIKCDSGIPCVVHGHWTEWSAWGKCVATCGEGVQTRVRTCTNPAPMLGGKPCSGPAEDMIPCDSGIPCSIDGGWSLWSKWSVCDAKCGKGFKYRIRTCTEPKPMYGGMTCAGIPEEKAPCDSGQLCVVHGGWSAWSSWDRCDAKCGSSVQMRIRTCTSPRPQNGGNLCIGVPQQARPCDTGMPCVVDGEWGPWTAWGPCDATCGAGRKSRFRDCDSPAPSKGGLSCPGFQSQVAQCDAGLSCVVQGGWTLWGAWSACSTTCGAGMQIRERFCTNPSPYGPGMDCVGAAEDGRICDTQVACPIHGHWSPWSAFGECIADCSYGAVHAEGFKFRERVCQGLANGGKGCVGVAVEKIPCKEFPPCPEPVWSMWSKWGKCSAVCGQGDRTRKRVCMDMNTKQPLRGCLGGDIEVMPCIDRPCPLTELNCSTECKWDNGIGYAVYPGDCSLFVQCDTLNGEPKVHDCPWGLLYSLEILQCVYPEQSECKMCSVPNERIPYHISCRGYWQCSSGIPVAMCCPVGQMFDPFIKECVYDKDAVCDEPCGSAQPYKPDPHIKCTFRESSLGSSWYEQQKDYGDGWITRPCGVGTVYSHKDCGCVHQGEGFLGPAKKDCEPELDLKFNSLKADLARNVGLHVEGVKYLGDGTAYFDGNAAINSNIFSNSEWGMDVYVYIRFKPDMTRVHKQGLVHNSGCGPSDIGPSVFIGFDREGRNLTGKNINMKFAAVPRQKALEYEFVNVTVPGEQMLDAWFKFGKGEFLAEVNGLTAALNINASEIARRHGALNIGGNLCRIGNEAFEGFVGTLDEVRIYKCKPKRRQLG